MLPQVRPALLLKCISINVEVTTVREGQGEEERTAKGSEHLQEGMNEDRARKAAGKLTPKF